MRYDFWKSEREKATQLDCGLKYLRNDLHLMIWKPKGKNPFSNYTFRNEEHLKSYLDDQIDSFKAHKKFVKERREKRKATPEMIESVKIGDIFHWSWGYDQTNCQYFQVVEKHGLNIVLKELCQEAVEGSQGFMSENRMPIKDSFLDRGETLNKRLQFSNGDPYVSTQFGWCNLWDGRPKNCSWYA